MNNSRTNNSLSENISKSFIQEAQPLDIIKGYQDSNAILEKLEENLEKGLISDVEFEKALSTLDIISKGGEGSKGGKVIGHTKSGKPIYDTANHASHANFSIKDHNDAADVHIKSASKGSLEDRRHADLQARAHYIAKKDVKEESPKGKVTEKEHNHLMQIKTPNHISNMSNSKVQSTINTLKKSGHLSKEDSNEIDEHAAQDNDDAFSNKLHESVKKYQESHK